MSNSKAEKQKEWKEEQEKKKQEMVGRRVLHYVGGTTKVISLKVAEVINTHLESSEKNMWLRFKKDGEEEGALPFMTINLNNVAFIEKVDG